MRGYEWLGDLLFWFGLFTAAYCLIVFIGGYDKKIKDLDGKDE